MLGQPIAVAQRFDPVDSEAETQRWTNPTRIPVALAGAPVVLRLDASGRGRAPCKDLRCPASRARSCAATIDGTQGGLVAAVATRPSASVRRSARAHRRHVRLGALEHLRRLAAR